MVWLWKFKDVNVGNRQWVYTWVCMCVFRGNIYWTHIIYARHCSEHFTCIHPLNSHSILWVSDFIFPIIEVRKRKLRENKQLAHDFSAHEWQSRDLNPHLLALESTLLTIMLSRDNPPLVAGPAVWTHFMGIRPGWHPGPWAPKDLYWVSCSAVNVLKFLLIWNKEPYILFCTGPRTYVLGLE